MPDEIEVLTCQFGTYDQAGNPITECQRTDFEEVVMAEDDPFTEVVRLCPKHRSWGPALSAHPEGLEKQ